ncbi:neuronal PAS domain-containing protein 2-like [Dendronephthya gigantea]|uniref:neuronal PAS domain-containing protein 2-like n=1 Tax=Dendronephthya gigantea TaxID=151771 RepID=UPI00106973CB|nr:neuronal PAS domain-containing protein 2-like [Dendronephthya gigantea]
MASEKSEKENKVNVNRASRNKSEKDRRDKVNAFISELASLVPGCLPESKKLDKATILKNTVDFMKVHNDLTVAITRKDTTCYLNSNELGQLMLEGCRAFLFAISLSGNFTFLSESVYDLLGYTKDDLIEKNMFDYLCPEDKLILLKEISRGSKTGVARNSGTSSFFIRFKTKYSDKPLFETLHCCGNFRIIKEEVKSKNDGSTVVNSNETCFVALASLVQTNSELDITSSLNVDVEFTSRQSLDGKFLYLDPRCIPITGYLPYEILGSMIYEFIHFDDLENISLCFGALLEDGEGETEDYRLLTKGSQWIVVKTSSYISYNHWNSKPEFICSTHHLVSGGRMKIDENSNFEESADGSDRDLAWTKSPEHRQSSVPSEQTTSNALLKNNTVPDVNNTPNSTLASSSQANTRTSLYSTLQTAATLERNNEGYSQNSAQQKKSSSQASSQSKDEISQRKRAEFYIDPNSIPMSPNSCEFSHEVASSTLDKNRQSLSTYWSGQSSSENAGMNGRFENPLAAKTQSQQNAEWHTCSLPNSNRYAQSPRTSQGLTGAGYQISNQYPHFSNENAPNVLQTTAGHPQQSLDRDFTTPSPQMSHGYFPSSPVNPERNFHLGRRSSSFLSSSSLPPSSPGSENYPLSPTTTNVMSPHIETGSLQPPSPVVFSATNAIPSPSPSLLSPTSPHHRMMRGYSTPYLAQSPHVQDRYPQSPILTPGSPRSSSPFTSPPTPNNSSQSLTPLFRLSPANSQFIVKGTNEAFHLSVAPYPASSVDERYSPQTGYPISARSSPSYSQSSYDYPDRSPQASTTPKERFFQSNTPFHSIPQDTNDNPRSPETNSLRSPVLQHVGQHDRVNDQFAMKSSQLASHNQNLFPVQSNQVYLPSIYHQTQLKKSAEGLKPCQINSDTPCRSPTSTSPGITTFGRDYQEQFTTGINREGRATAVFTPARSSIFPFQHEPENDNRIQTQGQAIELQDNTCTRYSEKQRDETCPVTHEQVIDGKNSTLNSMAPAKSFTYTQAQRILHNQLLEKQDHLHDTILKQKEQLARIQEQIILNAQAQFSLHEIGGLESTKEFQQQINNLEVEREQHKVRQKELKTVFLTKTWWSYVAWT